MEILRLTRRTGDRLDVTADRRVARLEFVPGGPARHVVVRTQPPAAPVTLDFGAGWRAADLRLGAEGRPAATLPIELVPAELQVVEPPATAGLRSGAWAFALLRHGPQEVRPELEEQMRALGYLQ